MPVHSVSEILRDSGCLDFVRQDAKRAAAELERLRPDAFALLTEEARESLRDRCAERLGILYEQALAEDVRGRMLRSDPVHAIVLSRRSIEPARKAAAELAEAGDIGGRLHERYRLLEEYEERIRKNFIDSYVEFFDALWAKREEIGAHLPGGRTFGKILSLTAGGADLHRHGRSVTGIRTDAGTVYYKPHDCGLDALYHEIVSRWFSDCTAAADVVEGSGFAFVTCLKREPVMTEEGLSDYYRNFGILSALFHGLGSCDMHRENLMACGVRPSAFDIETLTAPIPKAASGDLPSLDEDMLNSVLRIGILPRRSYRMPLFSPLNAAGDSIVSLPEYDGRHFTVEGFEQRFLDGFREGYRRLCGVRGEVMKLLGERKDVTVRCLLNHTSFYAQIRRMLLRPEYLSDRREREKVLHRLCVPFEQSGREADRRIVDHERVCLLQMDIPYFCAALDGTDLCGETTAETIVPGFFRSSAMQTAIRRLNGLSAAELRFEESVIREAFAQAPLDVPTEREREPLTETCIQRREAREIAASVFRRLRDTMLQNPDGGILWSSAVPKLRGMRTCGAMTTVADAGAYCASILLSATMCERHHEAAELAARCAGRLREFIVRLETAEQPPAAGSLPVGLCCGLGGVLSACVRMARAGIPEAREAAESLLRVIEKRRAYQSGNLTAAEGAAGLLSALADLEGSSADACIRESAERIMAGVGKPLSPHEEAGIGAALAAAYGRLRDRRCAERALEAFSRVRDVYDPALSGWVDSETDLRWLAKRGPHAPGIAMAAGDAAIWLAGFDGADALTELRKMAMESLTRETGLFRSDTLDEGNALAVLCLTRAGQTKRAGRILKSMRRRAGRLGCYTVTDPGIRSFFEPSFRLGTLGVGHAAIAWLDAAEKETGPFSQHR